MPKRGFQVVSDSERRYIGADIELPIRGSMYSAGYDIKTPIDFTLKAWTVGPTIYTDLCSYMQEDEVLKLYIRSGIGVNKNVFLINSVGVIDSDFRGNICFKLINMSDNDYEFKAGDRILQGVFQKYLLADDDNFLFEKREGGLGSTGDS